MISKRLSQEVSINCALKQISIKRVASNCSEHVANNLMPNLSEDLVNICGIYLTNDKKHLQGFELVPVASTQNNLFKIALGVAASKAICLQGPVGSGKTSLVEYLAYKTGHILGDNFVKIQLGDQTDSKMLLGTYVCTDVPGEFIWQPGVLTQASITFFTF